MRRKRMAKKKLEKFCVKCEKDAAGNAIKLENENASAVRIINMLNGVAYCTKHFIEALKE